MSLLARLPLRLLLTVPFVVLVAAVAAAVGGLSYRAGQQALDNWTAQLMQDTAQRITRSVAEHVGGSVAVLEAAFPAGVQAPAALGDQIDALRTRFWLATSVHREPNNYAYYGDVQGHFFGLWRHSASEAEVRLRMRGEGPRSVFRFSGIDGSFGLALVERQVFEPRQRPWFQIGAASAVGAWTPIYVDFKTGDLVTTLARRVANADGHVGGVVATDVSLQAVSAVLQSMALPLNGVALVIERSGALIGVSRGVHVRRNADGVPERLNAADSEDPLVAGIDRLAREWGDTLEPGMPRSGVATMPDGDTVQIAMSRLRDGQGLDWLTAVAAPRGDLLPSVKSSFRTTLWVAALAAVLAVVLGGVVLATVRRELVLLSEAAQHIGRGEPMPALDTARQDELGNLARSLTDMQSRLLTDALTGLLNRDTAMRRIQDRIVQRRRRADGERFAVLFADFNRFKDVNDRFGHEVGDQVLRETAQRFIGHVRAHDLVARYAGDEFLIVLDAVTEHSDALAARDKLEAALREPLNALTELAPGEVPKGVSIGMAIYPEDGGDAESLVRVADADMYRRKSQSR